jgi:hypothetical protein
MVHTSLGVLRFSLLLTSCVSGGAGDSSSRFTGGGDGRAGTLIAGQPTRRLCDSACVRAHEKVCKADRIWRIKLAPEVGGWQLTVAVTGLVRFSVGERALFSVDSRIALGCLPRCGQGAGTCLPYPFVFRLATLSGLSSCERRVTAGTPWHGWQTSRVELTCAERNVTIVVVPELAALRESLVLAGAIPEDDVSRTLDGLAVAAEFQQRRFELIKHVEPGTCADLRVPPHFSMRERAEDAADADTAWREASQLLQAEAAEGKRAQPTSVTGMFDSIDGEFCRAFHAGHDASSAP